MLRPSTARAASRTASAKVGWAWQVRAMSSRLPPNSIASDRLGDQVAGARAEDVHAEHAVGLRVGEHLDAAVALPERAGAAVGQNGNVPFRTARSGSLGSSSVLPTDASSGQV